MKDLVITGKTIRRELLILLGCFVAAVIFDIVGIIKYGKPFYEVFQTIGYEIVIAVAIYAVLAFFKALIFLIRKLFNHNPHE